MHSVEYPVDHRLRSEGKVLGILLVACFVLPWVRSRGSGWDGETSKMAFSWDLMGKTTSATLMLAWFVIAGVASIVLASAAMPRKTRAQWFFGLGLTTVLLFVMSAGSQDVGSRGGAVALILIHVIGLLALSFGTQHWTSRPGAPLAKAAIAIGVGALGLVYLVPIAELGRETKSLLSIIMMVFDAKESLYQLIGLYMLVPLAAAGLAAIVLMPPGPGGPAERNGVAKVAGLLAMLYVPGFFAIVWLVLMKLSAYREQMYALLYMAILFRAMFSWTTLGLDAALVAETPTQPLAAPPGPPCPRCATPAAWIGQYQRWHCARCGVYL